MKCEAKIFPRFNELTENLVKRKKPRMFVVRKKSYFGRTTAPPKICPHGQEFFREETNRSHLVWSTDDRILGSVLGLRFSFYGCLVFHVL